MEIDTILERLLPMYNITSNITENGEVIIKKDGFHFAMIKDAGVYLLNERKHFYRITNEIMNDADGLLRAATESFWIASGIKKK